MNITPWILSLLLAAVGCSRTVPTPSDLGGSKFPQVRAEGLDGKAVVVPDDYLGKETVLLVGYTQRAQFDIDRWILGILQADIAVQLVELPTIPGMMPVVVQGFITKGMRGGIPQEDWAAVATVFEDADIIVNTLGNDRPQNAYVVLLNSTGEIIWNTNRGYSAQQVLQMKEIVERKNS